MERPYTVALHGGGALPAARRIAAEIGFIDAIERTLGDPQKVADCYRAAQSMHHGVAEPELAHSWSRAYAAARSDAIHVAALDPDATFELRLTSGTGPA